MKTCSTCGVEIGTNSANLLCNQHYRAAYREKNKAILRVKQAAYYAANKEKALASSKAWHSRNPNWTSEYHVKNKAKRNAQIAAWAIKNKEAKRASTTNRRARLRQAEGTHTAAEIRKLFVFQNGCCAACTMKLPKSYHKDHITPISSGGSNWIENIQLLCPSCNTSKQHKDPLKFMQSLGFLL